MLKISSRWPIALEKPGLLTRSLGSSVFFFAARRLLNPFPWERIDHMYSFLTFSSLLVFIGQIVRIIFVTKHKIRFGKPRRFWVGINTVLLVSSLIFSWQCLWPYHCATDAGEGIAMFFAGSGQILVAALITLEFLTWTLLKKDYFERVHWMRTEMFRRYICIAATFGFWEAMINLQRISGFAVAALKMTFLPNISSHLWSRFLNAMFPGRAKLLGFQSFTDFLIFQSLNCEITRYFQ